MNRVVQDFYEYVGQTSEESMAIEVDQAKGSFLYSPSGKAYLDFISGICVSNLGHGDPDIIQAIWHQTRSYLHPIVYGEGVFSPQVKYAKALSSYLAEPLSNVYFTNSGSEAIEAAMKIAKKTYGQNPARSLPQCLSRKYPRSDEYQRGSAGKKRLWPLVT